jgi:hypothetical protein
MGWSLNLFNWQETNYVSIAKLQTRYLCLSVAENNRLGNGDCIIIKITKRMKLPFLFVKSNEELFDALQTWHYITLQRKGHQYRWKHNFNGIYLQGHLATVHKDSKWCSHELASHLQDLMRKSCREQKHLFKEKQIHYHMSSSKRH